MHRAGLSPEVIVADIDESYLGGESPVDYARRVAAAKAAHVAASLDRDALILAADTTVWSRHHPTPFGKAADREEAKQMLMNLVSLREHSVTTAWVLLDPHKRRSLIDHSTTRVRMRAHMPGELDRYLESGEWQGKAGAYAIQGDALTFIERVDGNLGAVIGLPIDRVAVVLRTFGHGSPAAQTRGVLLDRHDGGR